MYRQSPRDDPRSTMSVVEHREDGQRPNLRRGRSNTFSGYRPYEDAEYYNEPSSKQVVPQRRGHSVQRRSSYWDHSDADISDSSDDEYYRRRRSPSRSRGREASRRPRPRSPSNRSNTSRSRSRSRRRRGPPKTINKPKESYTLGKALKSAAISATVEAVRCRAESGPWKGQKSQRIAVAAASGAAIGSLRNGRLQKSGKLPYAEAAMTGMYSVDFLKRVMRQTTFTQDAEKEKAEREMDEDARDERRYARERSRSGRR